MPTTTKVLNPTASKTTKRPTTAGNAKRITNLEEEVASLRAQLQTLAIPSSSPSSSTDGQLRTVVKDMAQALLFKTLSVRDFRDRYSGFLNS